MSGISTIATTAASITLTTGQELVLQPGTNQVLTDLKGWHSAPGMRRNSTPRLWSHGNFSERGWRDARLISVQGFIFCDNRTDAAEMTDTLNAALADGTEGTFTVNDRDLGHRWAKVYMVGTPTVDWNGNDYIYFAVDMEAPDPRKYGDLTSLSAAVASPGGGMTWDLFATGGYVTSSPGNLLDNAGPYQNAGWGTSSAYVQSYESPVLGRAAMVWTKSGASYWVTFGRRAGSSGSGSSTTVPTNAGEVVPVTPGQTVFANIDLGTDATNTDGRIAIRFFDAAFASLSASESPVVDMVPNTWQEFSHSAIAPANTAYAWLEWGIAMKTGNTVGGERSWASDAYLGTTVPVATSATTTRGAKLRTNYAKQPSVEYVSTQWNPYGTNVTGAVRTDGGKYNSNYYRLTYTASGTGFKGRYHDEPVTVANGQTWTASMWVRPSVTLSLRLNMEFRSGAGLVGSAVAGTNTSCQANTWTRLTVTGTAAGAADIIRVQSYAFDATFPAGATYDLDAEQIELGAVATAFMDGTTYAAGKEYIWTGAAGDSVSEEYALVTGGLDFGAAGSAGTVVFTNNGTADTAPVLKVSGYAPGFTITNVATGARLIYTDTVLDGQYVLLNASDGSVLLNGYADRSGALSRREWSMIPGKGSATFLFESPGAVGATLTLEAYPAWW